MTPTSPTTGSARPWSAALAPVQQWWGGLAARERQAVSVAAAVLGLALVWFVAVQPAVRTLNTAPIERDRLAAQAQAMRLLAGEAGELRAVPPMSLQQSTDAVRAASERLGDRVKLSLQGERAVLSLRELGPQALSDLLSEVRSSARARPIEAKLTRGAQGYNGSLVLALAGSGS